MSVDIELLYSMIMGVSNINVIVMVKCNSARMEEISFKLTPLTKSSGTVVVTIEDVQTMIATVSYSPHKISIKGNAPRFTHSTIIIYNL